MHDMREEKYVYFGNLLPEESQYKSGLFVGLALNPKYAHDIKHDARQPMAFAGSSVDGFQSQDVFEHIEFDKVVPILDDVYRCLKPGGIFRMSLPDYNSPVLRRRSVYDCEGRILHDATMGGTVTGQPTGGLTVTFPTNGNAHVWFPTYANVNQLIVQSQIRKCETIKFHHAWIDMHRFVCDPFDQSIMPVTRTPPRDMRAGGKPVSLVVDFIK